MNEAYRRIDAGIQVEAVLRKRNQLTLPSEAVEGLGIQEGDVVIIEVKQNAATLRPLRRSYAGALIGIYGDADAYVERERTSWE